MIGKGNSVNLFGNQWEGKSLYPLILSLSLLIVLISSPLMGRLADKYKIKKPLLLAYCWVGSACTAALFFLEPGQWVLATILFCVANIGFAGGNVYYNALLKDVSTDDTLAKVSAKGWAFGYLGGFTLLVAQLVIIMKPELLNLSKVDATRWSLLTTGLWWAFWSMPLAFWVKEAKEKVEATVAKIDLKEIVLELRNNKTLLIFLGAFFLFNDAVETTISQAANMANELLGMELQEVLTAGVMIQFVAIFGSLLFLQIEKRWGTRLALKSALICWSLIMIWAMLMQSKTEFYIISACVGLVMGVTQSASRTLFGMHVPKDKSTTYFSFFTLTQKSSAMIGPFIFALTAHFFPIRYAILPLIIMLVGGTYLLNKIPKTSTEK
jgi:UMF1 family MFS transporter